MAKISARGDSERARWRHPETGAELVLTQRGRLLSKTKGGSFTLAANLRSFSGEELDRARERAEGLDMVRV